MTNLNKNDLWEMEQSAAFAEMFPKIHCITMIIYFSGLCLVFGFVVVVMLLSLFGLSLV